jgi:ABC-type phosphate transport system auxiliary subunit
VHHSANDKMASVAFNHSAHRLARELENRERDRSGISLKQARAIVARRLNLLPGTLENLRNNRVKDVRQRVADRLRAAYLRELEREHAALEHELQCLRATGARLDGDQIAAVAADLAKIRAALTGETHGS